MSRNFVPFVDENALPLVQRFHLIAAIFGLLLASTAVAAAILSRFPYWYTPYTFGSFLFFDRLSERFAGRSLLRLLASGRWRAGVFMYSVAAGIALVVDVVYGRTLAGAWVYPSWHGIANIAIPVFFHYPFGFLSLFATFETVRSALGAAEQSAPRNIHSEDSRHITLKSPRRFETLGKWYSRGSLIALALRLVVPLLNYWFNANHDASELLFVVMLVSTAAFDGIRELMTGDSMLRELVAEGWRNAVAIAITLAWAILINEGPNVFAREWVYLASPFGLPLWLILILGWPFLLVVSAAVYETAIALTSRNLGYTGIG